MIHERVTTLHFQATVTSLPVSFLQANFFLLIHWKGIELIGEVKRLGYSSHSAFLLRSAVYLLSYTHARVPCWIRATRKNVNILKPFWVNHEQLSPNIPYTVFKMCNRVPSAPISHVAPFPSSANDQSPAWLLMHENAHVWLGNLRATSIQEN